MCHLDDEMLAPEVIVDVTRNKRAKGVTMTHTAGNVIKLTVPDAYTDEKIASVIEKHRPEFQKIITEWTAKSEFPLHREYVNGAGFLYLGRPVRLQLVDNPEHDVVLTSTHFELRASLVDGHGNARAKKAFEQFYTARGVEFIAERILRYAPRVGKEPTSFSVEKMKRAVWGLCSDKGVITWNYRLMMAPIQFVDHSVVHELCHLVHMNHSPAYWGLVNRVFPDYDRWSRWGAINGPSLTLDER